MAQYYETLYCDEENAKKVAGLLIEWRYWFRVEWDAKQRCYGIVVGVGIIKQLQMVKGIVIRGSECLI